VLLTLLSFASADTALSASDLPLQSIKLGMHFYAGKMFPSAYHNRIFIAEHASWNRSAPIGYRVTMVTPDKDRKADAYEVFAEGWLQGGKAWGRPVDVLVMPDGALLVFDDKAGVIYRISYSEQRK
jgi:glucose/arabinose dehydrogenase